MPRASELTATTELMGTVRSFIPGRTALILAAIACALTILGIVLNYFSTRRVEFSHCVLALGLLAFVVWFSGRKHEDG